MTGSKISQDELNSLMEEITEGIGTKADKMRELDRHGHSRADIARFLGVRYQQVRNTLEGDKRTGYNPDISRSHSVVSSEIWPMLSTFRPISLVENGFAIVPPDMFAEFCDENEALFALELKDGIFLSTAKYIAERVRVGLG
jgi:hypothetical protein